MMNTEFRMIARAAIPPMSRRKKKPDVLRPVNLQSAFRVLLARAL
jgi:hypothetical protein